MSESSNPYTRRVAEFVSGLRYEAIPREVRERAKLLVLDSLGCALYGARLEWCRILQRTLKKLDSSTACGVWGTAQRLSAPHAALANGTQIQGFELDDVHREGVLHVGAVVLPALVAVAELRGLSGREFLTAAVAAFSRREPGRRAASRSTRRKPSMRWASRAPRPPGLWRRSTAPW